MIEQVAFVLGSVTTRFSTIVSPSFDSVVVIVTVSLSTMLIVDGLTVAVIFVMSTIVVSVANVSLGPLSVLEPVSVVMMLSLLLIVVVIVHVSVAPGAMYRMLQESFVFVSASRSHSGRLPVFVMLVVIVALSPWYSLSVFVVSMLAATPAH